MNKTEAYLDLQKRQQKELEDFPIAYAFNEKQLEEALKKLGAKKEECVTLFNHGDVLKKTDVPAFKTMLKRHTKELQEAMKNEDFAEAAFLYEMDNHPSGDCSPSREDVNITKKMKEAGDLIGIEVLDHIIVGENNYCSLKEKGHI